MNPSVVSPIFSLIVDAENFAKITAYAAQSTYAKIHSEYDWISQVSAGGSESTGGADVAFSDIVFSLVMRWYLRQRNKSN
jgi:hypothetical protein